LVHISFFPGQLDGTFVLQESGANVVAASFNTGRRVAVVVALDDVEMNGLVLVDEVGDVVDAVDGLVVDEVVVEVDEVDVDVKALVLVANVTLLVVAAVGAGMHFELFGGRMWPILQTH
jgi:hypothetical protein